jgi:hypothetical protein
MNQPLFPIDSIESYLRSFVQSMERHNSTLRWHAGNGISELSVAPVQVRTVVLIADQEASALIFN